MTETCGCPPEAGNQVCETPPNKFLRPASTPQSCPVCGKKGKPVQGQTVKALLAISLREVLDDKYYFCMHGNCPVVYYSSGGAQTFHIHKVREKVYQKEPENEAVMVCYCFRHTVGDLLKASAEERQAVIESITVGINSGQCACDLRNPQGSCCLGNVQELIKGLNKQERKSR
jgi:hypothetical protein